jgi:DNA-binding response OmpR family regulator
MSNTLGSNAVEVYIHRLRRKLEDAGAVARIENIRGVGYLLRGEA